MAREYAKVLTRIWGDDDFVTVPALQQRMYLQLISQPDLSMAGVLTYAPRRWALQVQDQDEEQIRKALAGLVAERMIVIDESTQELLIRSYIRIDEAWRSPTSMKGIDSSVRGILSRRIKGRLIGELERIDTAGLSTRVSEKTGRSSKEAVEAMLWELGAHLQAFSDYADAPSDTPWVGASDAPTGPRPDAPSHAPTDAPWEGARSRATEPEPETTPEPEPEPETFRTAPTGPYPEDFEEFWEAYPRRQKKGDALKAFTNALKRTTFDRVLAGAQQLRDDPNRVDQYTPLAATWLNADGWEDDPLPERARPQTFDQARHTANNEFLMRHTGGQDPWSMPLNPTDPSTLHSHELPPF